jgi:hypothetical protein
MAELLGVETGFGILPRISGLLEGASRLYRNMDES